MSPTPRRPRLAARVAIALVACLTLVLAGLSSGAALGETSARGKARTTIGKLNFPPKKVANGQTKYVKGKLKGGPNVKRTVRLQMKLPFTGWRTVKSKKTSKKGGFKLKLPTGYYHSKLKFRVVTPATRRATGKSSRTANVTVVPAYTPAGSRNSWTRVAPGTNWRYDPCSVINYRVNPQGEDPGAVEDAQEAVRQLEIATGLRFRYKGETSTIFGGAGTWPKDANLIITWASQAQTKLEISTTAIARGGPQKGVFVRGSEGRVAKTTKAGIVMSNEYPMIPGFGTPPEYQVTRGQVLMHELAHTAGLGHVLDSAPDPAQLMDGSDGNRYSPPVFGLGDLQGLKRVGISMGCMKPMRNRTAPDAGPVGVALP